ncbi:Tetracycline resistance protein, class C [compost metagenome]
MNSDTSPPKSQVAGMVFIFITVLLDIMGIGLIIPLMPQLVSQFVGSDLAATSLYYGALGTAYTLAQFLFAPMLGALSDQFGRRPLLLISLAVTSAAYLLTAIAPSMIVLFVARALGGIGGASMTVAAAYIADVSSHEDRAKNFGMLGAAFGLGFIAGPAVGGYLGTIHMHLPFYAAAGLAFANFLYGLAAVPESHKIENRKAFTWGQANPVGWVSVVKRHPVVTSMAASLLLFNLAHQCLHNTWVLYTAHRFGWSPADNGTSLAVVGVTTALVQGGLIRVLLPRWGERNAILIGMALSGMSLVAYGLATQGWMMYAIIVVASIGGVAGPAVQGYISKQVDAGEQGAVQGALTGLMSLTGVVAPMLASSVFATFTAAKAPIQLPGAPFFLGACFCAGGIAIAFKVLSRPVTPPVEAEVPVTTAA